MSVLQDVIDVLQDVLQVERSILTEDTVLLGGMAEFDSMAVVSVITALEDNMGITVDDDEISAETFETVGSLVGFVEGKTS